MLQIVAINLHSAERRATVQKIETLIAKLRCTYINATNQDNKRSPESMQFDDDYFSIGRNALKNVCEKKYK